MDLRQQMLELIESIGANNPQVAEAMRRSLGITPGAPAPIGSSGGLWQQMMEQEIAAQARRAAMHGSKE